jgi:hypothetical protein
MLPMTKYLEPYLSWTALLLRRGFSECEGFGAKYRYSVSLMIAGAIFSLAGRTHVDAQSSLRKRS